MPTVTEPPCLWLAQNGFCLMHQHDSVGWFDLILASMLITFIIRVLIEVRDIADKHYR